MAKEILAKVLEGISKGNLDVNDESIPLGYRIQDKVDIAVAEIKKTIQVPLLSNQVVSEDGTIIVHEGSGK
ncbi:hypothetical protein [uncultured Duncaniella sp.]|uniref:hypothetical protein n=1 Tax=uncultured Duncaniella sp. TaxID=2768039 RepID=UPI00262E534B|nr:hypothetical protein [uncultured Duncaniella sp.]